MEKCRPKDPIALNRKDGVANCAQGIMVDDVLLYSGDTVKGMALTCSYCKAVTLLLLPNFSYSMMDVNFQTSW